MPLEDYSTPSCVFSALCNGSDLVLTAVSFAFLKENKKMSSRKKITYVNCQIFFLVANI